MPRDNELPVPSSMSELQSGGRASRRDCEVLSRVLGGRGTLGARAGYSPSALLGSSGGSTWRDPSFRLPLCAST
jgi:hypothetical protein